jgi:hypothetical protein
MPGTPGPKRACRLEQFGRINGSIHSYRLMHFGRLVQLCDIVIQGEASLRMGPIRIGATRRP